MCGFVAIYLPGGAEVDRALLDRMTDSMAHRGPDGRGTYVTQGCGLGHRRLAIIDLEGGVQPLAGRDERVRIVFNGEAYNYRQIKQRLPGPWRTQSDTEVFLRSYESRGLDGLEPLVGMWGAAIWDGRTRELVVIRDRLGVKPVYLARLPGGGAIFASEIRPLLLHPDVRPKIDLRAVDLLLTYRFVPAPATLFAGIEKLQPGHAAIAGEGGIRIERWWRPIPRPIEVSDEEAVSAFSSAFDAAVSARMVSDVPAGVFLSGGMDSAAVLQAAGRRGADAFTIGFEGAGEDDEIPLARDTAEVFGAAHHAMTIGPGDYARWFDGYVAQLEEPVMNDSAIAVHFLSAFARKRVKVVLSGQGADEPLAGYDRHKGELLSPYYRKLPCRSLFEPLIEGAPLDERMKRAARSLGEGDDIERAIRIYAVFQQEEKAALLAPSVLRELGGHDVAAPLRPLHEETAHLSPLGRMLYTDTRLGLVDDLLLVADKLSMAHGLELRVPFLDHRLVELLEGFPDAQKLRVTTHGLATKWVHRQAMRRRLPPRILARKKRGFTNPMDTWLRRELSGLVAERLLSPGAPVHGLVRPEAIRRLRDEHQSRRHDRRRQLFMLLTLDAWMRAHLL